MAKRYPQARLMGLDASTEMLRSAQAMVDRAGLTERLPLVHGFAEQFDPAAAFGLSEPLDRIVFSYSLSMIPPWREAIEHAVASLKPGGPRAYRRFRRPGGLARLVPADAVLVARPVRRAMCARS